MEKKENQEQNYEKIEKEKKEQDTTLIKNLIENYYQQNEQQTIRIVEVLNGAINISVGQVFPNLFHWFLDYGFNVGYYIPEREIHLNIPPDKPLTLYIASPIAKFEQFKLVFDQLTLFSSLKLKEDEITEFNRVIQIEEYYLLTTVSVIPRTLPQLQLSNDIRVYFLYIYTYFFLTYILPNRNLLLSNIWEIFYCEAQGWNVLPLFAFLVKNFMHPLIAKFALEIVREILLYQTVINFFNLPPEHIHSYLLIYSQHLDTLSLSYKNRFFVNPKFKYQTLVKYARYLQTLFQNSSINEILSCLLDTIASCPSIPSDGVKQQFKFNPIKGKINDIRAIFNDLAINLLENYPKDKENFLKQLEKTFFSYSTNIKKAYSNDHLTSISKQTKDFIDNH